MTETVRIVEVGPRDGLQNEKIIIPAEEKVKLVNMLSGCGLEYIEVTSFVSPKWVPQLADAAEVMAQITRNPQICYAVLIPNLQGYEKAKDAQADEVAIFASASESFSQKNINCSIAESLERFQPVLDQAQKDGIPVRAYVSCVIDCPYEGQVFPKAVAKVVQDLLQMGCYEVSLGDTTGAGDLQKVAAMLDEVLNVARPPQLAGHFHDTNGRALENITVCLESGLRVFDSSVAGLGGCPYAPGAKGNVSTHKVVDLCHTKGFKTGIDLDKLRSVEEFIRHLLLSL